MQLGYIGLGKMGINMVERLLEKGHEVVAFDVNKEARKQAELAGAKTVDSIESLPASLEPPRLIWLMVPHKIVDKVLEELTANLQKGDTIIDGGNSFYKDSMRRAKEITAKGIRFLDVGVSGGPGGARSGACLMVGGEKDDYERLKLLFRDLATEHGYGYMGKAGAGHFVKMVHNGIEYGMMQSLAEGFAIMKNSEFDLDLTKIADLYNHGSVVESQLVEWLKDGFEQYGENLEEVSGSVGHTGEGEWTAKTAEELGVSAPIIKGAFDFRVESAKNPSYIGKILSALRNQFGKHSIK